MSFPGVSGAGTYSLQRDEMALNWQFKKVVLGLLVTVLCSPAVLLQAQVQNQFLELDGVEFEYYGGIWQQIGLNQALFLRPENTAVHRSLKWQVWYSEASLTERKILELGSSVIYLKPHSSGSGVILRAVFPNPTAASGASDLRLSTLLDESFLSSLGLVETGGISLIGSQVGVNSSAVIATGTTASGGALGSGVAASSGAITGTAAATSGTAAVASGSAAVSAGVASGAAAGTSLAGIASIPAGVGAASLAGGSVIAGAVVAEQSSNNNPLSPAS